MAQKTSLRALSKATGTPLSTLSRRAKALNISTTNISPQDEMKLVGARGAELAARCKEIAARNFDASAELSKSINELSMLVAAGLELGVFRRTRALMRFHAASSQAPKQPDLALLPTDPQARKWMAFFTGQDGVFLRATALAAGKDLREQLSPTNPEN